MDQQFEKLDLLKTYSEGLERLKFPYLVVDYGQVSESSKDKATLIATNRSQILQQAVEKGVLDVRESRHLDNVDIFPIITLTGTMFGRINKWGKPHTNIVVSYPGINGITDDEKRLIMALIGNEPYISKEPKRPLILKNLVFGEKSNVKLDAIGLEAGYVGPLFNFNAEALPISLERAFWDDQSHRNNNTALYELALNTTTGIIIKPTALRALRKKFFPGGQTYSIRTDEVAFPAPRTPDEA